MHGRALTSVHIFPPFVECLHWVVGWGSFDLGGRHHSLRRSIGLIRVWNRCQTCFVESGLAFRPYLLHRGRLGKVPTLLPIVSVDVDRALFTIGGERPVLGLIARQSKHHIESLVRIRGEIVGALTPVSTSASITSHPMASLSCWEDNMVCFFLLRIAGAWHCLVRVGVVGDPNFLSDF